MSTQFRPRHIPGNLNENGMGYCGWILAVLAAARTPGELFDNVVRPVWWSIRLVSTIGASARMEGHSVAQ